jgi:hypothetical protein
VAIDVGLQFFRADAQSVAKPDAWEITAPENLKNIRATDMQDLGDFVRIQQGRLHGIFLHGRSMAKGGSGRS